MNCCGMKSEYKHTDDECKVVVAAVRNLIRQIVSIDDKEFRQQLGESAKELCNQLLREPDE